MLSPNKLRKTVLDMVFEKKSGHIGGSFSLAELISLLYSEFDLANEDRKNKLILYKAHCVPILYAALHELGKITKEELKTFREINSRLQGHCDKVKLPLLDFTGGSLGQGLSVALGHALAKNLKKERGAIFCILGDCELAEGEVWEALMCAPKFKLKNLICIIDWNKIQSDGYVQDVLPIYKNLKQKIVSFGWDCRLIDGHNIDKIRKCLNGQYLKPLCIILSTIKGKGVSFMENAPSYHSQIPTKEEYEKALKELGF